LGFGSLQYAPKLEVARFNIYGIWHVWVWD
jgi:hypothetical protein